MGDPTTFRPMNEIILRNVALLDIPICPLCLVIDKYIHMYICSQLLVDRGATVVRDSLFLFGVDSFSYGHLYAIV